MSPLEATFELLISIPLSPFAVNPSVPEAPTAALFCTVMSPSAAIDRFALSFSAISGAPTVAGVQLNAPALTVALSMVASPET